MLFYLLKSLQDLLVGWSSTPSGRNALASVPRDQNLASQLQTFVTVSKRLTGVAPNSNVLSKVVLATLS